MRNTTDANGCAIRGSCCGRKSPASLPCTKNGDIWEQLGTYGNIVQVAQSFGSADLICFDGDSFNVFHQFFIYDIYAHLHCSWPSAVELAQAALALFASGLQPVQHQFEL